MCVKCEKSTSHVGKRVKLEQNMWATCEHMWIGDVFHPHADAKGFASASRSKEVSLSTNFN